MIYHFDIDFLLYFIKNLKTELDGTLWYMYNLHKNAYYRTNVVGMIKQCVIKKYIIIWIIDSMFSE